MHPVGVNASIYDPQGFWLQDEIQLITANRSGWISVDVRYHDEILLVQSRDQHWGGVSILNMENQHDIVLRPVVSVKGRLVDQNNRPEPFQKLELDVKGFQSQSNFHKSLQADKDGWFVLDGVIQGVEYVLCAVTEQPITEFNEHSGKATSYSKRKEVQNSKEIVFFRIDPEKNTAPYSLGDVSISSDEAMMP